MTRRPKKEPFGWIGPVEAVPSSLGKSRWRAIDSTGQWIAAGFTTRALALRWIDGFHLMRAGYRIEDHEWLLSHWYPALPARLDPETRAPAESSKADVLISAVENEGEAAPETTATNPGSRDP